MLVHTPSTTYILDSIDYTLKQRIQFASRSAANAHFTPEGSHVIIGCEDGVQIYNLGGEKIWEGPQEDVRVVNMSPKSLVMASGSTSMVRLLFNCVLLMDFKAFWLPVPDWKKQ
jgi:hypothetical protein